MTKHKTTDPSSPAPLTAGATRWSIEDILAIAQGQSIALSSSQSWRDSIQQGADFLEQLWQQEGVIYGVTTGYGASCDVSIPPALVESLPLHLTRFHGCGMGEILDVYAARAVMAVRLCSLCQGFSGVRLELLEQLVALLNHQITPLIPEEGSVGASGDLTPLSYVAAALMGEREVTCQGQLMPAQDALSRVGLRPIVLRPKEGLALMNGTSVMTALSCIAFSRASYLARLCARITAMASVALQSNPEHFHARLFEAKPHPGQQAVAGWIRGDLPSTQPASTSRLQERYSIRCAPHVIGVLVDALPWMRTQIETEINSANDNPIIDATQEKIFHGGHFYGGHIAFVMDGLKNAVANLADLLDRQMALLVDPNTNHGLPANLSGSSSERSAINHGLKAVQIGASAWTAEALKLTMPASVFSRSTECHNQDKVSMGTIAARDALRVLQLSEQVAAALLLSVTQALSLRIQGRQLQPQDLPPSTHSMLQQLQETFPLLDEDRPLEATLRHMTALIQQQQWSFDDLLPRG